MTAWRAPVTLAERSVTLRPLTAGDRDALLAAAAEDHAWTLFFTGVPGPETIDAWLARTFEDQAIGRALPFAVCRPDGSLIGSTRFMRMNEPARRVEIGYTYYAASARRSPVNSESKLLLLGHAFDVLGTNVVEIRTDWHNMRSQAAIERLGAKRDGVLRSHSVAPDGRVRDLVVYSILATEWPGVRANLRHLIDRGRAA